MGVSKNGKGKEEMEELKKGKKMSWMSSFVSVKGKGMNFQPQDPQWNPNFQKPPNQSYLEALPIQISSFDFG
ncbi:hypothetical protein Csa_002713, partial [Cucumis sativus]